MILINLLSNETLQNLIPIIALRPTEVIHIASKDGFVKRAKHIELAYQRFIRSHNGYKPINFSIKEMSTKTPTVEDTYLFINDIINGKNSIVINFTGATKQMSIGAYLVGRTLGAPTYYCDTQAGSIVPGGTNPSEKGISIEDIFECLDVEVILEAYGNSKISDFKFKIPTEQELRFGKISFNLIQNNKNFYTYIQEIRNGKTSILPETIDPEINFFLECANELRLLIKENDVFKLPEDKNRSIVLANIDGIPFEYYVFDCIKRSNRYSKPLHSVAPVGESIAFGEVDIICVDKIERGLTFISCKSSFNGANKLEHLESFAQRANNLGGRFSKKILCIANNYYIKNQLKERCKQLDIELYLGDEITKHFVEE
jgi:hypothetical protein